MKTLLVILCTVISGVFFGQTSDEIIESKINFIVNETDSLVLLKNNKQSLMDTKISTKNKLKDSLLMSSNYDSLKIFVSKNDSTIKTLSFNKKRLLKLTEKSHLLKLLIEGNTIKVKGWGKNKEIKIENYYKEFENYYFFSSAFGKNSRNGVQKDAINELIETVYQQYVKDYYYQKEAFDAHMNYLSIHDGVKIINSGWRKITNDSDFEFLQNKVAKGGDYPSGTYAVIPFKVYVNWRKNIKDLKTNVKKKLNLSKMDEDDYLIVRLNEGLFKPNIEFTDEGALKSVMWFQLSYNAKNVTATNILSRKNLDKTLTIYKKYDRNISNSTKEFWMNYFKDFKRIDLYLMRKVKLKKVSKSLDSLETLTLSMKSSIKNVDNEISKIERSSEGKINKLKYQISGYANIIKDKENRIIKVKEDEALRVKLISEADSLMQIKNYEIAISKYKQAQELYNHPEVTLKLDKAIELYAPILEKRKEEERLAKIEQDRIEREAAEQRVKDASSKNATWHSENVFLDWLEALPFFNYEKNRKIEFEREGSMVWVLVNGEKEGVLEDYSLHGSPHRNVIEIRWIRNNKLDGFIVVNSSYERVRKSLRGQISGIQGVTNASNLRREGCPWE